MIHVSWQTILQSVIASSFVSWPVFAAGLWVQHRRVKADLHKVTQAQTTDLQHRLDKQTAQITGRAAPGTDPDEGKMP